MTILENTERFRLGTGQFMTRLFYLHGTVPLAVILCLVAVAVVLAMAMNILFIVVALMIVFIFAPAILAWLYVSKGMVPEATFNITWHKLSLSERGIAVDILKPVYKKTENDGEEDGEKETISSWITVKTIDFGFDKMKTSLAGGDGLTVPLKGKSGFIAVPYNAFPTQERYKTFINTFYKLCTDITEPQSDITSKNHLC